MSRPVTRVATSWGLGTAIALTGYCVIAFYGSASAQITPDGTLGPERSIVKSNVNIKSSPADRIDGGATRGTNLFHSFQEFNVRNGQRVYFANPKGIKNILGRVTGENGSDIQGTLGVLGKAKTNLFLINPNGILFGQDARLDVKGSFVASTADSVLFDNNLAFSATDPQTPPLLTISVPLGLQFKGNPGSILVQGDGEGRRRLNDDRLITPGGLRVESDQTLALVGGNVVLEGATLKTAGGRIELGSVAGPGQVSLTPKEDKGWAIGYDGAPTFGDIQLSRAAAVDASGEGGGDIQVQGRLVKLTGGSQIDASRLGSKAGGTVSVTASESVELLGTSADVAEDIGQFSAIIASVHKGVKGKGAGGNVTIQTQRLIIRGGGKIRTATLGEGIAGTLTVKASKLVEVSGISTPEHPSRLSARTIGKGDAKSLTIETEQLIVKDGGLVDVSSGFKGNGKAGSLTIKAGQLIVKNGAQILASTVSSQGGDIKLKGLNSLEVSNGGQISTSTQTGQAGNLSVNVDENAADSVQLSGPGSVLSAEATGSGGGAGSLTINTKQLRVEDGAEISASTVSGEGKGIKLEGLNSLQVSNGGQISASTETGQAGSLSVDAAKSVELSGNGSLSVEATGDGTAGSLTINTKQLTVKGGAEISASTVSGEGRDIKLEGLNSLQVSDGGQISASTETGQAGSLGVEAAKFVKLSGKSGLSVKATGDGTAGSLTINTSQLTVEDEAEISASTISGKGKGIKLEGLNSLQVSDGGLISTSTETGQAGSLSVNVDENAADSVQLSGPGSVLSAEATGSGGGAGNLTINTQQLTVENGAKVSASTISGEGGDIKLKGLNSLQVINGEISASTATGQAGSLSVNVNGNAAESVKLSGQDSGLSAEATGSGGGAGSLTINTKQLTVENEAKVSAKTASGKGGNIMLEGLNSLEVSNGGLISASTETGQAGNLNVDAAKSVKLSGQGSALSVEATKGGTAGNLTISTKQLTVEDGRVSTETTSGEEGGDINLKNLNSLEVSKGSQISTSTETGQAGSLSVNVNENAADSTQLSDQDSGLFTQATGNDGKAGSLTVNTKQLTVQDGAEVSAATTSGKGGNIKLEGLNSLKVSNKGQISASTRDGQAGSLSVDAAKSVELSGKGGLSVEATEGGTAGNLTIDTEQLTVQDEAAVTVSSLTGKAGNLTITADIVRLDKGRLSAQTGAKPDAADIDANINLQDLDLLLLENGSLISAEATYNDASGGNINIKGTATGFIIATPREDSDIIAKASGGPGGKIEIETQGIFGIKKRKAIRGNETNDIDASSGLGPQFSGIVEINTPDIDPAEGLANLPTEPVNTEIAQDCQADGGKGTSRFVRSGSGGLPTNPYEPLDSLDILADVQAPSQWASEANMGTWSTGESSTRPNRDTVVEAQGWGINATGEVVLVSQMPRRLSQRGCRLH